MDDFAVLDLLREAMLTTAKMALPLLVGGLVVGLVVGLVQALTSIQEMTLTFLPKIGVMLGIFLLTLGYMTSLCLSLFDDHVITAIAG